MSQRSHVPVLVLTSLFAGVVTLAGCVDDAQDAGPVPTGQVQQAGGALDTCWSWTPTGTGALGGPNSVAASCHTANGAVLRSEVWLPGCVRNVNGVMTWSRDGFFDRSCKNCFILDNHAFACNCFKADGSLIATLIDLNGLTNVNGNLVCPI